MSKTPGTAEPGRRNIGAILLWAGLIILTVGILLTFVTFFAVNATQWTPVPTYTATFNGTQAQQATSAIQSLTPPPTRTAIPPTSATQPAPGTGTVVQTTVPTALTRPAATAGTDVPLTSTPNLGTTVPAITVTPTPITPTGTATGTAPFEATSAAATAAATAAR
jgi:hypothetical protein